MEGRGQKTGFKRRLYHLLLWAISIAFFSPIIWMIICSLKTREQILTLPPEWLFVPTLKNYIGLFHMFNFTKELMNSIFMFWQLTASRASSQKGRTLSCFCSFP
jgi:ABC-type glycerol-3-phosphate transport system permease component